MQDSNYSVQDVKVGEVVQFEYAFSEERINIFADLVDDFAPIHFDDGFALNKGFKGRIVHGLFAQSVLSGFLGNILPGPNSVINHISTKMLAPIYIGSVAKYSLTVAAVSEAVSAVILDFSVEADEIKVMSGRVQCSFPEISPNAG